MIPGPSQVHSRPRGIPFLFRAEYPARLGPKQRLDGQTLSPWALLRLWLRLEAHSTLAPWATTLGGALLNSHLETTVLTLPSDPLNFHGRRFCHDALLCYSTFEEIPSSAFRTQSRSVKRTTDLLQDSAPPTSRRSVGSTCKESGKTGTEHEKSSGPHTNLQKKHLSSHSLCGRTKCAVD
jgi:hypothetical protein